MILNNKYYIQDIESGEYEEVSKEYYYSFESLKRIFNDKITSQINESIKGKVIIFGTGGEMEGDNLFKEYYQNNYMEEKGREVYKPNSYFVPKYIMGVDPYDNRTNYDTLIDQAKEELNKWIEYKAEGLRFYFNYYRSVSLIEERSIILRKDFKITGRPITDEDIRKYPMTAEEAFKHNTNQHD